MSKLNLDRLDFYTNEESEINSSRTEKIKRKKSIESSKQRSKKDNKRKKNVLFDSED